MRKVWFVMAIVGLASASRAEVQGYRLAQGKDGPGISTALSYSFGTHRNRVTRAQGEVRLDPDLAGSVTGELRVPIDALVSDSAERDCHMREALGLDYKRSRFPDEHLCSNDRLPAGAVVFQEIILQIRGGNAPAVTTLAVGKETPISVDAAWTIHGVTRPARLQLTVSRDAKTPGAVRIHGTSDVRLADFGVVVKSAQVLFVKSSVGDTATVQFDLTLVPHR
jgi:polyisoprenoid-binding protein YceI